MVENANGSHDLTLWDELVLSGITWITDHNWGSSGLFSASDACHLAFSIECYLVNVLVEHIGSSMDGAQTTECLWKSTKTVDWVKEATGSVLAVTVEIELHLLDGVDCWLVQVGV